MPLPAIKRVQIITMSCGHDSIQVSTVIQGKNTLDELMMNLIASHEVFSETIQVHNAPYFNVVKMEV